MKIRNLISKNAIYKARSSIRDCELNCHCHPLSSDLKIVTKIEITIRINKNAMR